MLERFHDRNEAGRKLADALISYANKPNLLVLGLPRGGVPVAYAVAEKLHAPLDVFLVRKLGVPGYEELAMGALAWGDVTVFNEEIVSSIHISQNAIKSAIARESEELKRRNTEYRGNKPFPKITGKTIILIDDGLATGATMKAAVTAIQQLHPEKLVVAIPVAAVDSYQTIKQMVDEIVCLETPEPFYAVGAWYSDFSQTTDGEVITLLKQAHKFEPNQS